MKICDFYSHKNAEAIVLKKGLMSEINQCLNQKDVVFIKGNTAFIKEKIDEQFNNLGWADNIKLNNSGLSIN